MTVEQAKTLLNKASTGVILTESEKKQLLLAISVLSNSWAKVN